MKLYHGSTCEVRDPHIIQGRLLDFGYGFYTTSDIDQARQWAIRKSLNSDERPVVNTYEFDDETAYKILKIISFESPNSEWLSFVVSNRRGQCQFEYDMAIGPVADDTVYRTIVLFESGTISVEMAVSMLKPETLRDQYLFHTERALELLNFEHSEVFR